MMSAMGLRIREAHPDDAERIAAVHVAAWQAGYEGQLPADFLAGLSDDLDRRIQSWRRGLAADDTPTTALVAEDPESGELFGFTTYGTCRDDDVPPTTGELWAINLHRGAWGRGVGSALFLAGVDGLRADGYRDAVLWVLETNTRARRFYEKHGWNPDGHTKVDQRETFALREVRYAIPLG
jgi:ribosomal protein S18 acetylase RimI-like enzyme